MYYDHDIAYIKFRYYLRGGSMGLSIGLLVGFITGMILA